MRHQLAQRAFWIRGVEERTVSAVAGPLELLLDAGVQVDDTAALNQTFALLGPQYGPATGRDDDPAELRQGIYALALALAKTVRALCPDGVRDLDSAPVPDFGAAVAA